MKKLRLEEEKKRILNEALKIAESKKREALIEAKEEIHENRIEFDKEIKEKISAHKPEHRNGEKRYRPETFKKRERKRGGLHYKLF